MMTLSLSIGLIQSVWFDEAYSIMLAKLPAGELLHLTSVDTHPPLYYLLLKAWAGLFGWSEIALRSLSVLAMGGAAAFGILLVRRMFGTRAALMTLPFVILAPFLLRYGLEIRMYALASLIGVAATYVLVAATESGGRKQWLLYGLYAVLVAVGVYTLYYTALLWIAHVVWLVWLATQRKESIVKQKWWLAYAGSVVLFLPWIFTFVKQLDNGALAPIAQQLTTDGMVGIVSFWFLYQPAWQLNGLSSLVIVAIIAGGVYGITQAFKAVSLKQKRYFMLLAFYAGIPVLAIAFISLLRPMYVERYLAHVLIGLGLFLGVSLWLVSQKKPRTARLLTLSFVAVLLFGTAHLVGTGNYNFQRLHMPQMREAAEIIECSKDRQVVAEDPYVAIELGYYLTKCDVYFYSEPGELKGGYSPLIGSKLDVTNSPHQLKGKQATYVYYEELRLGPPSGMRMTKEISFGPLHVAEFSAE